MKLKNTTIPIRAFRVSSKSEKGKKHIVELWSDGVLSCGATSDYNIYGDFAICKAGLYNKPCRHKKIVRDYLRQYEPEAYKKLEQN